MKSRSVLGADWWLRSVGRREKKELGKRAVQGEIEEPARELAFLLPEDKVGP
jgi:hypothetical protein